MSDNPKLYYFPLAGRAELIRAIASCGGLNLIESADKPENLAAFGSPSGIPVLEHGLLKMAQSTAIENYLAMIAPKYTGLTPAQRGIDSMFMSIKEEIVAATAKLVFGKDADGNRDVEKMKAEAPVLCARWMPVIEGLLPAEGFINGLEFPTVAGHARANEMTPSALYQHEKYWWSGGSLLK